MTVWPPDPYHVVVISFNDFPRDRSVNFCTFHSPYVKSQMTRPRIVVAIEEPVWFSVCAWSVWRVKF